MPSPIGHTLFGALLYETDRKEKTIHWKKFGLFVLLANLPDMHYVPAVILGKVNRFHHSGFHSITMWLATTLGLYAVLRAMKRERALYWAGWCLALYGTHLLLDYFCMNNYPSNGLQLFCPFSDQNFTAPFHFFADLRKGSFTEVFGADNMEKVLKETAVISVPLFALSVFRRARRLINRLKGYA